MALFNLHSLLDLKSFLFTKQQMWIKLTLLLAAQTAHVTACSWSVPFKVGVHFDADDAIGAPPTAPQLDDVENDATATTGAGLGYSGFYFDYWQNSC